MKAVWLAVGLSLLLAAPVLAQEPEPSMAPPPPPDLASLMPEQLGTFETEITVTRGEEHISDPDADGQQQESLSPELSRLLEETGSTVEDMTSAFAFAAPEGFFAFVVALQIAGVEEGALLRAYLPILRDDLIDPTEEPAELAGRELLVINSVGAEDEIVPLYVYAGGDTIWMLQGPEDVVEQVLEGLP